MKIVAENSYDLLVVLCETGKYYHYYKMKRNNGIFEIPFILKFIELVRNGDYHPDLGIPLRRGCDRCLKDVPKFCAHLKKEILLRCGDKSQQDEFELDEPVIINIMQSLDKIIKKRK